ncbi:MAG: 50S ribosomal protein L10 [Chlamydiota bacterium]
MRPEKKLLVESIKGKIEQSKAVMLLQYSKFSPSMSWKFAAQLKKPQGRFEVMKKRIFFKAAEECGLKLDNIGDLTGHMGVLFVYGDALDATKVVFKFSKDNESIVKVLGGRFEGQIYSAIDLEALSNLPSLIELRAQFLGLLEAPMVQVLTVMDTLLTSVIYCLENKSKS